MVGLLELFFKECEVSHEGSTVSDVGLSHAFLLSFVLAGLQQGNHIVLGDALLSHHISESRVTLLGVSGNLQASLNPTLDI